MVSVTRDLLSVLLERADAADPDPVDVRLGATPAGDLVADSGGGDRRELGEGDEGKPGRSDDGKTGPGEGIPGGSDDLAGLDPDTPVLTHFYFPGAGESVSAVFGMDLGAPASHARFRSHPDGNPRLTEADDLAAVVLIATPPYDASTVRAFDRRGRRVDLRVLDAAPPEERLDDVDYSR